MSGRGFFASAALVDEPLTETPTSPSAPHWKVMELQEEGQKPMPASIRWLFENQRQILAIHSSKVQTAVFAMECQYCERFYKYCMFSNAQKKADDPMCTWCQLELDATQPEQCQIRRHIWCNKPGKKRCGEHCELEPPKQATMEDVKPTGPQYVIKPKKMSLRERKAANHLQYGT